MQERHEIIYDLLERFYSAKVLFDEQHREYEHRVLQLAAREGVDRLDLRLSAQEVARLLNFEVLSDLRDNHLLPLKELSHRLFGGTQREPLDIMVSDMFHLVSILKEEEFRVSHYAILYDEMRDDVDRDYILDAVHHDFPLLLNQTARLFGTAEQELFKLLPSVALSPVVIRSLFLFGPALLRHVDTGGKGIDLLYEQMYPDGGPLEGYLRVAESFVDAGFRTEGEQALAQARRLLDPSARLPHQRKLVEEVEALEEYLAGKGDRRPTTRRRPRGVATRMTRRASPDS